MLGWVSLFFICGSVVIALLGLLLSAPSIQLSGLIDDSEVWRILRFTLWQACLSTVFSSALAIPFARALARRHSFWGRQILLRLSSLTLVIPSMVAVFGIAIVHGRNGWLNQALAFIGIDEAYSLYGLNGILIAHLFFNIPLAARIYLTALQSLPTETWRLASQLGIPPSAIFRLIEWPVFKSVLLGVMSLIFMLCFTSFAIILTLGGGPKYATLEVAIYQAFRFDFDIARGVLLALVQIIVCLGLLAALGQTRQTFSFQSISLNTSNRPDTQQITGKLIDASVLIITSLFLLSPILAVFLRALSPELMTVILNPPFQHALFSSSIIAISSGILALFISLPISFLFKTLRQKSATKHMALIDMGSSLILVVPPLTLGMGLFLVLRPFVNVMSLGLYLVILVNALLAVPFVLRVIQPPILVASQQLDRLSHSLGITPWQQFKLLYWPIIRQPIGFALALASTLSLGDMGVIALFGTQDLSTLPLLIYRLFGAYKMDEAAVVAMLLCVLCGVLFWSLERIIGGRNHA